MLHRGRPIALSVGNYTFGTPGRPSLDYGLLLFAHATGRRFDRVELVPLAVYNGRVEYQPVPLAGDELAAALERLIADSARYGARLRREGGRAILDLPSEAS
jgi:hypothetical protein